MAYHARRGFSTSILSTHQARPPSEKKHADSPSSARSASLIPANFLTTSASNALASLALVAHVQSADAHLIPSFTTFSPSQIVRFFSIVIKSYSGRRPQQR